MTRWCGLAMLIVLLAGCGDDADAMTEDSGSPRDGAHSGRAAGLVWLIDRQEVSMTQSALSFLLGVIAPLTLVGWLIVLH